MNKHKLFCFEYQSFVKSEKGALFFFQHCKKECNTEAFEFCKEVEKFCQNPTQQFAQQIINTFICEQAPKEINLSNKIREPLLASDLSQIQLHGLFDKAYFANLLLISQDVFSRFIRTSEFFKFVEQTPDKQLLQEFGAQLMSTLPEYLIHVEHMEQGRLSQNDMQITAHMLKDYYNWELIHSDVKLALNVYKTTQGLVGDDLIKKFGKWSMSKFTVRIDKLNALELLHILYSKEYAALANASLPSNTVVEFVTNESLCQTITYQTFKLPLAQVRDLLSVNTVFYNPSNKTYYCIFKSCNHAKYPEVKEHIRAQVFTVYTIQEVGPKECLLTQVIIGCMRGYIQAFSQLLSLDKEIVKREIAGLFKARELFLQQYETQHKYEYKTPYDIIPGFTSLMHGFEMLQANGVNKFVLPS